MYVHSTAACNFTLIFTNIQRRVAWERLDRKNFIPGYIVELSKLYRMVPES